MQIFSAVRWSVVALAAAPFIVACSDPDQIGHAADAGKTVDASAPVADASLPDGNAGADTTLPERLELGAVGCGTTATVSFELPNRGPAPLAYSFTSLGRVSIAPSEGIVAPGSAQVIVVAARVPALAAARTAFAATAIMTSNARQGRDLSIPITFHAQGATIVMPSQISFGDALVQTAVSRTFTVRNDGDVAAQVEIPMPKGEISVQLGAGGGPVTVEPGGSVTGEARYVPINVGVDSALPGIEIAGPSCGERPVLLLSGQGVPRGGVVVGAGPIDFGDPTCDVAAPGQSLQLTNPATSDATFTAAVVASTATDRIFHVSPSSGIVPAGESVTLTVTSDAIAGPARARVYAATLRVTTRLDVSTVHAVPIRMNLRAASLIIAANVRGDPNDPFAAAADLGFVPVGTTAVTSFEVANLGNKVATLTPSLGTPFHITAPATIAPGAFVDGTIEYSAVSPGPVTGLIAFATGDACAPPITLALRAGVGPAAIIEPATATTTSPAPDTVSAPLRVTNSGNAPLDLECAEHRTRGALQLAPSELTIPAGGTDAFTVTMVAGPNATAVVQRDIRCRTNQRLHEIRDTTMTLTVVPAE